MPRSKRMGLGEGLSAEVTFTILATLHQDYGGGENFLHDIQGKIVIRNVDDETEEPAGEVRASLVQFNEAQAHGINTRVLGDCYSHEISTYWQELFDGDDFRVEIQNGWQTEGTDLLIIASVHTPLKFEGNGIGLAAFGRTIDLFSRCCDLVACFPEGMKDYSNHEPDSSLREARAVESDEEEAIGRLKDYCLKSGFRPLGQTGIYLLNPTHERPDLLLE